MMTWIGIAIIIILLVIFFIVRSRR